MGLDGLNLLRVFALPADSAERRAAWEALHQTRTDAMGVHAESVDRGEQANRAMLKSYVKRRLVTSDDPFTAQLTQPGVARKARLEDLKRDEPELSLHADHARQTQ